MSGGPISVLRVELSANTARFAENMGRAKSIAAVSSQGIAKALDKAGKSFEQAASNVFSLRNAMNAMALFTGVSVGGLALAAKKALDFSDTLVKMSAATGVSTNSLQELRYAAMQSGLTSEQLDSALGQFNKTLGQARIGTGALAEQLKIMDPALLSILQHSGTTEQALVALLKAIDRMKNSSDKAAVSSAAFGKTAGVEMLAVLSDGIAGMEAMRKEARDLGLVLDERVVRDAEEANDKLEKLGMSIKTNLMAALLPALPVLGEMADKLTGVATASAKWLRILRDMQGDVGFNYTKQDATVDRIASQLAVLEKYGQQATDEYKELEKQLAAANAELDKIAKPRKPPEIPTYSDVPTQPLPPGSFKQYGPPQAQIDYSGQFRDAQRVIEETATAQERQRMEVERIVALKPPLISLLGSEEEANKRIAAATKKTATEYQDVKNAARQAQTVIADGLTDAILEGKKFDEVLKDIGKSLLRIVVHMAMMRMVGTFMGMPAGGASAHGNVFAHGKRVKKYRTGGVVTSPTMFPMARGAGLMGEAGPEAILPLKRIGGDLGVQAELPDGGGATFQQNISVGAVDFSDERSIRRILQAIGDQAKSGTSEALRLAGLLSDRATLNSRRAF